MKIRKPIPSRTKKMIFQEAQSQCPFCGVSDVDVLQIHHIDNDTDNHSPENLILACSNCHSKITSGSIPESKVRTMKLRLSKQIHSVPNKGKAANVISITGGQNSGIIANVVNIKNSRKDPPKQPPAGSIGTNLLYRNYTKYLIDRYNEFKKADKSTPEFSYAVIYNAIKTQFKAKWDFLPVERFWDLITFLQNRIDKTIIGRGRKSHGDKNYESFEEYKARMES